MVSPSSGAWDAPYAYEVSWGSVEVELFMMGGLLRGGSEGAEVRQGG